MSATRRAVAVAALLWAALGRASAASWTATTPLPDAYNGHAMVFSGGRLYHLGGISFNGGVLDGVKVFSSAVAPDGTIGAWMPGPQLPEAVFYHTAASVNGFVYVLGGYHYTDAAGFVVSGTVYYARPGPGGATGAWQTAPPLPQPVFFPSAAVWNGRIYVTGGWNGSNLVNSVYSAAVNPDGSLGPWTAQKPLPEAVYTHAEVANGTLYVLGGTVHGGADIQNTVYYAKINADGSLGDWATTSPLPSPLSNHGAVLANGRVIALGGWTGSAPTAAVESAAVAGDGSLGAWSAEASLPVPLYLHASAADAAHVFVSGGIDAQASRAEVYSLPLPPPPAPSDFLPPRTSLAFAGTVYGAAPFVSPATQLRLSAVDDATVVGDGAGVGVASTRYAVDDGPFAPYSAPFELSGDGAHWVRYFSLDAAGNAEVVSASSAAVDGTPPVSSLSIGAPQARLATGEVIVGPATPLTASASDPVVNGAASGAAWARAAVDGAAPVSDTFALPASDGPHSIVLQSADNVGNVEAPHAATVYRDGTPPVTTLAFSAAPYAGASGPVYGAATTLGFSAEDPASGGASAGVNRTESALDGGAYAAYAGPFGVAEGVHSLSYRSVDNVGNVEAARAASFAVDATPPQTTLSISGAGSSLFGEDLLTPDAALSLSAQDPASAGVASGVKRIVYSVDGAADAVYSAPFHLAAGRHVVSFAAEDNAGNVETNRSVALSVGALLSDSLAASGDVALSGSASVTGSVRADGAFTASGKASVSGDVSAASVSLTGKANVSGTVTRGAGTLPASTYDLAAARAWARAHNANASLPAGLLRGGALVLSSGKSATLPAGDYYLTGLTLSGKASVSVSGRVNVFLDGPLTVLGGSALNASGDAADLWIVDGYSGTDAYRAAGEGDDAGDPSDAGAYGAYVSGNGRAAFNLYAPPTAFRASGNGAFAGRVLAASVSLSGRSAQPSTTALPAPTHGPGSPEHRAPAAASAGAGTASGGKAGGREAAVAAAVLTPAAPSVAGAGGAAPSPGNPPSGAAPASSAASVRTAPSRLPSFAWTGRAAFAPVGADGAAVRAKDRAAVVIPQGAATGLAVTVAPSADADPVEKTRRADVEARKGLVAAAGGVQYGPEGTVFAKPVTLELPYDRASLPAGVAEKDLAVHYWNPTLGDWERLPSSVDTAAQVVRAQTGHFSLYQLFSGGPSAPAAANDPAFSLRAAYAFPSPSRGGAPVVFRVQPGAADSVSVRVYDLSGRLIHQSSDFNGPRALDDGNGLGSQLTYEHAWDVSGVGSGVYRYVITVKKAGAADLHAEGKVGVIK